jgi:hypothetical protein
MSAQVVSNYRFILKHVKSLPSAHNWKSHIRSKVCGRYQCTVHSALFTNKRVCFVGTSSLLDGTRQILARFSICGR